MTMMRTALRFFVGSIMRTARMSALILVLANHYHANAASTGNENPIQNQVVMGNQAKLPIELQDVGVIEHLGETIALDQLMFTHAVDGKEHLLRDYFQNGKPTVLNLVYFQCPMLCTMVLNGVLEGLRGLDWSVGKEFNILTISIDPTEDADLGLAKRDAYLKRYFDEARTKRASLEKEGNDWHFFTGRKDQIEALAKQVGFSFKYDKQQKDFAHPAVTFILTPQGKVSRYLYGIQPKSRDFRFALLEASQGKVGTVIDRLLMFCYHYDPSSKGYSLQAIRVMQLGGAGTVTLLGGFLTVFWTRQRKGKQS